MTKRRAAISIRAHEKNCSERSIRLRAIIAAGTLLILCFHCMQAGNRDKVYFTTGLKIGEVTDHSAVIWTRLCGTDKPQPVVHQRKASPFRSPLAFDEDMPVDKMDGAVTGKEGEVRIILLGNEKEIRSRWMKAEVLNDYTVKFTVDDLKPRTNYTVRIEGRVNENNPVTVEEASLRTAPHPGEAVPVLFTSCSCQYFWDFDDSTRGFKMYDSMSRLHPDFYVQTGDYVYYDKSGPMATTVEKARHKWHANNAWPSLAGFFRTCPIYLQKDDHDMLKNDAYPGIEPFGNLTFEEALKIWYEQSPLTGKPYRTFRWGKDLQIWLVEGREFRSPNPMPDGPEKTIWGKEQMEWLKETVTVSDATFKVLFSPTPVVGPDRDKGKNDNYSNKAFETEGREVRAFLASQKNLFVVNGDRHWQYVSVDDETGLMEFSQGPSSDSHAQGWKEEDRRPEHRFLRVKGGFLAARIERLNNVPTLTFMHYDVEGRVVHEEVF